MNRYGLLLAFFFSVQAAAAQRFARITRDSLVLDNGVIRREIGLAGGRPVTRVLSIPDTAYNFVGGPSPEFSFRLDGSLYDNRSGWTLLAAGPAADDRQGDGVTVRLAGQGRLKGIEVALTWWLYPGLPVVRKEIAFTNRTAKTVRLESVTVEDLRCNFSYVEAVVYANYAREKHLGPYTGNWDDALMAVHSYTLNCGLLVGNEAPGVLKRSAYAVHDNRIEAGLTPPGGDYPFRKYIAPGKTWRAPKVFLLLYAGRPDPSYAIAGPLGSFLRRHLGLRIFDHPHFPVAAYNTWTPFRNEISDSLVAGLAPAVAACGVDYFMLDDGWSQRRPKNDYEQTVYGDWTADTAKFPSGLGTTLHRMIREKLTPGLWLSLSMVTVNSDAYRRFPQYRVLDREGRPANIHTVQLDWDAEDKKNMCFAASGWRNFMRDKILDLAKTTGVRHFKLDLACVTSAYVVDPAKSGCYAKNHDGHRDREESFIAIYENLFAMFDELHRAYPDLLIDCTFETEGKIQLIDYAFCQHAEVNWLSNVEEPFPTGGYRLRDLAWWKSAVMPASALLIGNRQLDNPAFPEELKSLIGTFPIVLGDPRKLDSSQRAQIRGWMNWLGAMRAKYDYWRYRQDLPGFGEPAEGQWDGWSRLNTETGDGGLVGVFKQNSPDAARLVRVYGVDAAARYNLREAPTGRLLATVSGAALLHEGFEVKIAEQYGSAIFELERVKDR